MSQATMPATSCMSHATAKANARRPIALVCSLLLLSLLACDRSGTPASAPTLPPATNLPATQAPPTAAATNNSATQVPATAPAAHVFDPVRFKQQLDPLVSGFMAANNVAGCSVALVYPDPG